MKSYISNKELAELIIKGKYMPNIYENHSRLLALEEGSYEICALGMGLVALAGNPERAYLHMLVRRRWFDLLGNGYCARTLNIPKSTARWIIWQHCNLVPALTIAHMLKTRPDPKPFMQRVGAWFQRRFARHAKVDNCDQRDMAIGLQLPMLRT